MHTACFERNGSSKTRTMFHSFLPLTFYGVFSLVGPILAFALPGLSERIRLLIVHIALILSMGMTLVVFPETLSVLTAHIPFLAVMLIIFGFLGLLQYLPRKMGIYYGISVLLQDGCMFLIAYSVLEYTPLSDIYSFSLLITVPFVLAHVNSFKPKENFKMLPIAIYGEILILCVIAGVPWFATLIHMAGGAYLIRHQIIL